MARRRSWLAGGAAACLGWGCSPVDLERAAAVEPRSAPMLLSDVAFEGWSGPVRELSLEARRADVDLDRRVARLEQVRIALRGGDGVGPVEVSSPTGEFDLARDALWLRGGVEGRTRPGERFATDELRFNHSSGTLESATPVHLERGDLMLDAASMDLDLRARRLHFLGPVDAELKPR